MRAIGNGVLCGKDHRALDTAARDGPLYPAIASHDKLGAGAARGGSPGFHHCRQCSPLPGPMPGKRLFRDGIKPLEAGIG
jgi:hypothetical protein